MLFTFTKAALKGYVLGMMTPILEFLRYRFNIFGYNFSFWQILIGVEVFDLVFTFIGKCFGKMEVD